MRQIPNTFTWYARAFWSWPTNDTELERFNSWVADLDYALERVEDFSICVQAGGACGVWPARLAQDFATVITFEPDPENFMALVANTRHLKNISALQHAVSDASGFGSLQRNDLEKDNAGASYLTTGGEVSVVSIDDLNLPSCGLIQLNIEGREISALQGAEQTLRKYKPVVMIEEKPLPQMADQGIDLLAARRFLGSLGYQPVAAIHRDIVFIC